MCQRIKSRGELLKNNQSRFQTMANHSIEIKPIRVLKTGTIIKNGIMDASNGYHITASNMLNQRF